MDRTDTVSQEKRRVATISLLASGAMAVLKFAAAFATGSLGLLSEAFHSLVDFGATVITLVAVRLGDKPADDTHHFGHAKVESVAALVEILLLAGIVAWFAHEGIARLLANDHSVEVTWWAIGLLVLSIIVDFNRSRALRKVAVKSSSGALSADAAHFESDMYGSFAVLAGLLLVAAGLPWGDSVATLVVAAFIAWIAWRLARQTLATLLDAAPEGLSAQITERVEQMDGILSIRQLRIRPAGPVHFVSAVLEVARTMPLQEIVRVKRRTEDEIRMVLPGADIHVSIEPVELQSETVFEKVMLVAAHHGRAIHHLTVQNIGGKTAVSFDCEFDGSTTLDAAHEAATALETSIRLALGGDVEVESHIEPLPERMLEGRPADEAEVARLTKALRAAARPESALSDIHNVRVRETDEGQYLHYHCRFAGPYSVQNVHAAVDRVEQRLMAAEDTIRRVIAHAEPVGSPRHAL